MYQLSVFIHIMSATVWVGGMFFVALVAVPALRRLPGPERGRLLGSLGRRFRLVGWITIALLLVSGIVNSVFRGVSWESLASGEILGSGFGQLLAIKLVLVTAMLLISVVHDFIVGPASVRALEAAELGTAGGAERLRRWASWLARVNAILALVVIGVAVVLVRGLPW
jgi:uncharacterized membrane protein